MTHRRFPLCGCSNPNEHGTVWVSYCKTVEIIDIPGNHFTLLSQVRASPQPGDCLTCLLSPSYSIINKPALFVQDEEDMELMMEAMKVKLSACGIGETSDVHNKDPISANQDALVEATSALAFLEASGVPYFVRLKVVQVHHALLSLRLPSPS